MKLKKQIKLLIAADGGAASGKTTGAKLISKKYNLNFLSSGLLYRYIAFCLIRKKYLLKNNLYLKKIAKNITPKKLKNRKLFDHDVTLFSAKVAKLKKIRLILKKFQKNFAKKNHVCIEGRDIGSVICPKADIKLFFKCNIGIRAKRRWKEYRRLDPRVTINEIKKALKLRDYADIHRKHSPLRAAKDSIVIDTSKLNKKQMLKKISNIVESKLILKYGRNYKAGKK